VTPCLVVLDTNALLDWLVFKDPVASPLNAHLAEGRWRWLACEGMVTEWGHVWPRPVFSRWQPDPQLTTTAFERAHAVDTPPRGPLKCKDPDDQVFIDLALHHATHGQAVWLFSKDAALLKLARRARLRGVHISTWQAWQAAGAPTHPPLHSTSD
jgi:predicted nucleic acid-binding protein